jgi:tetratricopeptide (TPR) repeat protein
LLHILIGSDNTEAYESYLKGRYYLNKFTVEGWTRAIEFFEEATRMEPEYALAHAGAAYCCNGLWYYGLHPPHEIVPKWKAAADRALELDLLSLLVNVQVGLIYWHANRLEDALGQARRMIEIEPNDFGAYWLRGGIYLNKGMQEESIAAYEVAVTRGGNNIVLSALGSTYGFLGFRDKALAILNQPLEMKKHQYVIAFDIARIYAGLGENDLAFEWLEKACEDRNGELVFLNAITKVGAPDSLWEGIRNDPRLSDLLGRLRPAD